MEVEAESAQLSWSWECRLHRRGRETEIAPSQSHHRP